MEPDSDIVPTYQAHAFMWPDGVMRDLRTLGGRSSATSLNNRGEVVGTMDEELGEQAFLWRDGVITSVGPRLAWGTHPSINDRGTIAPTVAEPDPEDAALENGRTTVLGALETGASSVAEDLNNRGQVVGQGTTASGAFLWSGGMMTALGTLGGENTYPKAINDRGQVVGWSDTKSGNAHAFLWQNGMMTDLGTLDGDVQRASARDSPIGHADRSSPQPPRRVEISQRSDETGPQTSSARASIG